MAACCTPARAVLVAETRSHTSGSSRVCSGSSSTSSASLGNAWSAKRGADVGRALVGKKGHLGIRFTVVWNWAVASKGNGTGLVLEAAKRVSTGRSYALSSTLKVEEGNEEQVASLCKGIVEWAHDKQKDKKCGIQGFECNVDAFEKNTLHFWEIYESFTRMNDIRASPEHSKFMMEVRPLLTGPIALAAYEYRDGQIGHMMNPIGPKGEGGLDDATGQAGSKQQSAVINQGLGDIEERETFDLDAMNKKMSEKNKAAKSKADAEEKTKAEGWSLKSLLGVPTRK